MLRILRVLAVSAFGVCLGLGVPALAENLGQSSDPGLKVKDCRYGPDTCIGGYVWRGATSTDHVCVAPQVRDATHADNQMAGARRTTSGGAYGPDTCKAGFVWRGTTPTDHICVTGQTRSAVQADNAAAASRKACR
jgi:hypothetical protein